MHEKKDPSHSLAMTKIAVITSSHGVRGQVKIHSFLDDPLDVLSHTPLTDLSGKREFKLKKHGVKESLLIVSIDGVDDRNAADLLRGTELFALMKDIPLKNKLTGMEARLIDSNVYGRVIGVFNFGAGDIIEIEFEDGKTEMIPLTEQFVGDINEEEGSLVVYPPEYLEGEKDA
jgi:16S rRNA processing protein RimM